MLSILAIANTDKINRSILLIMYYVLALYDVAPTCGATAGRLGAAEQGL